MLPRPRHASPPTTSPRASLLRWQLAYLRGWTCCAFSGRATHLLHRTWRARPAFLDFSCPPAGGRRNVAGRRWRSGPLGGRADRAGGRQEGGYRAAWCKLTLHFLPAFNATAALCGISTLLRRWQTTRIPACRPCSPQKCHHLVHTLAARNATTTHAAARNSPPARRGCTGSPRIAAYPLLRTCCAIAYDPAPRRFATPTVPC